MELRDEVEQALVGLGMTEEPTMMGMHLAEIEEETSNILDLLITIRVMARQNNVEGGQDTLVELTTALEHLLHHAHEALPSLQRQLDLADDEETLTELLEVA